MMKHCCERFRLATENLGKKGLSIYAQADPEQAPFFLLAFRSVDKENQLAFVKSFQNAGYVEKVHVAMELAIKYCPWCGKELPRFYDRNWRELLSEPI